MTKALTDGLLSRLSDFVASRMALNFPPPRWGDLERMASSAYAEMGFADPASFIEGLLSSPLTEGRMEILAAYLTVGETYFWREPQVFEALESRILPDLIRSRGPEDRRLRIWCAGCSTGEEPYSVAIALRRALPAIDDWSIRILATDINPRMLRKAAGGSYGEWSFRNAPPWIAEEFFRLKKDGKREILPEIRKMVSFEYLNLAEDIYPASLNGTNSMDLILCRNVLMYFTSEGARLIVGSLRRALVDGGWLITSACECSQVLFSEFASVQFPGATVYRKDADAPRPEESPSSGAARTQMPLIRPPPKPSAAIKGKKPPMPRVEAVPSAIAPTVRELADKGRLGEALALCETAIIRDKMDPRLHYLKSTILQGLNRECEAIASLKRTIYLDPESVHAYFTLGNLALRNGDERTGKRCFKNALALLAGLLDEEVLPDSEGLTAGRFREIISATMRIGTKEAV
jgi:chemotaxis protein methyltransferase CheR